MRIIGGEFSSRRIKTLEGTSTRPTLDKVREAVFSSLGGSFSGGTVLDLYAGSGAIGLEALSRGMDEAVFCEKSRSAATVIKENIASLGVESRSRLMIMPEMGALMNLKLEGYHFDLVYLDPPYKKQKNQKILSCLVEYGLLENGANVVIESLKDDPVPNAYGNLEFRKEAIYGITRIIYYVYRKKEVL